MAFGAQDFAAARPLLSTKYGVISQDLGPLRLSLGKGTGPNRMNGVFGGGELKVAPWLQLVGEYDTTDKNLGTKFLTPPGLLPGRMTLGLTTKYSLEAQPRHVDLAFSLRVPLGRAPSGPGASTPAPSAMSSLPLGPNAVASPSKAPRVFETPRPAPEASPRPSAVPANLARDLTALGFENVRTGVRGRTLVVEYENNRFNHNEADGIGLVLGTTVTEAPEGYETFLISLRKQNLRMLELEGPINPYRNFFRSWDAPDGHLIASLSIRQAESFGSPEGVTWDGEVANQGWLNSRLILGPGLNTAIGTEVGAFNYRLSVLPDLQTSLWRGAVLNFRWDVPVSWSQNYRPGQPFGSLGTTYSLDRIWVAQVIPLAKGLMAQVGGGRYALQTNGAMGDLMWTSGSGQSRIALKGAQFQQTGQPDLRVALGSYRFYYAPMETSLEITGGRFYNNDQGFKIDLKRYYRDTAFDVWYSNTNVKKLGFTFSIPLTPRRDMAPGWLQVRGTERWDYSMSTVVRNPDGRNPLLPNEANVPDTTFFLERSFYSNDRLNEDFLRSHLTRLREAYQLFKPAPRP